MQRALKEDITENTLEKLYKNFIVEYGASLLYMERMYLDGSYKMGLETIELPDIVREVYDMFNLLKDDKNIFLGFKEIINKKFGIDKNIIEVGGGLFPTLAKRISLSQKKGSITVYDPRLYSVETEIENLKLVNKKFDHHTSVSGTDLIIGLQPYGATEELIRIACENNIDFMVALGKAEEFSGSWFVDDEFQEYWERRIINRAAEAVEENNMGTLKKTSLKKYGSNYPVIYNQRT